MMSQIVWDVKALFCSAGSFAWKAEWGPDYHQSMYIGISSLVLSIFLALGEQIVLRLGNIQWILSAIYQLSE